MRAQFIGSIAQHVLAQQPEARVYGITSRGVFVHTASDWVIFLSGERYRGPLTLNLAWKQDGLPELAAGETVMIQDDGLWFPRHNFRIITERAELWSAPPRAAAVLPAAEIQARLEWVYEQVQERAEFDAAELDELSQARESKQADRIAGGVGSLLGRGTGLTPAGDDLAAGMLLALNRWRGPFYHDFPVDAVNSLVVELAKRKTTTLAANLIACAAQGQADERIVTGLDGLVTGIPNAAACADCFNGWGNSSGANAFVGIRLALLQMIRGMVHGFHG